MIFRERGNGVEHERAYKGVAEKGVSGAEPPGRRRNFQIFWKKSMKKLKFRGKVFQFFDNFNDDYSNF